MASFSLEVLLPDVTVKSSVDALGLNGSTDSDVDAIPVANLGMVFRESGMSSAAYFGVIAEAGLHLKFLQSRTNPILIAQGGKSDNPFGGLFGGFGTVETQLEVIRVPIGFSCDVNDKWSAGVAFAPSLSRMMFTPAAFAAPDSANGDAIPTYPDDIDHAVALGVGLQAGARYKATDHMSLGFTLTTPTWFEPFVWETEDEAGQKRIVTFHLNRPLTVSMGANYLFPTETLILMDASWINFSGTQGFDDTGFASDGSLKGLGFDDIFVVALGVQQKVGDAWSLRCGYNYCTNPIEEDITFFNVGSPLHNQHHLSLGVSWAVKEKMTLDIAYTHAFETSQSGPMYLPAGEVPGTEAETALSYEHIAMGLTMNF
jgi:long-chain fatty acid transport protein